MSMEKVSWIQNGSNYRRVEGNISNVESIPVGIYNVCFNPLAGWSLEYTTEKFEFPFKLYGLENQFIDHVLKTFNNTKSNIGILLNGIKGTGKTISAKILANKLNLPVIIVKSFGDNNSALMEYISSFNFDCVLFLDEFEKTWSADDSSILQIMDGVYTSQYRRIFLLTTNETKINENLISRPSRIRYFKEFGNLEREVVLEYLKDNLKDTECVDCIVDFVDTLQISTIDILKTIVEDVNIHGFDEFIKNKDFFNVKTASYSYRALYTCLNEDYARQRNYNIDSYLKDIKVYEKNKQPYRYYYDTDEEFAQANREYHEAMKKIVGISSRYLETPKSFKSFKVGDHFGMYDTEKIVQIDYNKKVVITRDDDDESFYYYYIDNPNVKPSLYSSSSYTNPYFH